MVNKTKLSNWHQVVTSPTYYLLISLGYYDHENVRQRHSLYGHCITEIANLNSKSSVFKNRNGMLQISSTVAAGGTERSGRKRCGAYLPIQLLGRNILEQQTKTTIRLLFHNQTGRQYRTYFFTIAQIFVYICAYSF